ncbi:MAG: hypothetical protein P8X42_10215 [Calditrichaceae bacterium]
MNLTAEKCSLYFDTFDVNNPHKLVNRIQDILLKSSEWHPGKK